MTAVLLECGHAVTEVEEIDGEHRCGACAREAVVDSEAVEEAAEGLVGTDQPAQRQDGASDSPPQPVYGTRAITARATGMLGTHRRRSTM